MELRSGTFRKIKPRCIVNYTTSRRPAIDASYRNSWPWRTRDSAKRFWRQANGKPNGQNGKSLSFQILAEKGTFESPNMRIRSLAFSYV
jgi:hypothetical protein